MQMNLPSKFTGRYTNANRRPISSFVKEYSFVPITTSVRSLHIEIEKVST